ncbi:MAG: thiamine pyrophosphate-binding protein [Burkholderiales bacterium]
MVNNRSDKINELIHQRIKALSPEKRALLKQRRVDGMIDGHASIALCLKELGVTHVYGISGTPVDETLGACAKVGIRSIGVRHQQAGVMMALAQNYMTGRLTAVVICSAGPAITNAATGILIARDNGWPLIVLGGRRPLSMQGKGCFQELDALPIFASITKWSAVIENAEKIPQCLSTAFRITCEGRPGPVYLDVPEETLTGKILASRCHCQIPAFESDSPIDTKAVTQAAEVLLSAKRPLLVIGKGVRWSEPYPELLQIVEAYSIPFITSPMGRGVLPDDHPYCVNAASTLALSRADTVLMVGARLNWTFRFGTELAPYGKLIQIDIDEQEIGRNLAPCVGIVGDAKQVLRNLVRQMSRQHSEHAKKESSGHWIKTLALARNEKIREVDSRSHDDSVPMSPYRMMGEIRSFLPRDAICVLDGNVSMAVGQLIIPSYSPASRFTAGTNGCMGVGIPFGIGAKLSDPHRLVMVICGDFAFGLNAMELETAVRHKVPIIVVVVNNEGNTGALKQKANYPEHYERVTMFSPNIRYERLAGALGCHAEYVERPHELIPALKRAAASGVASCISVKINPHTPYPNV